MTRARITFLAPLVHILRPGYYREDEDGRKRLPGGKRESKRDLSEETDRAERDRRLFNLTNAARAGYGMFAGDRRQIPGEDDGRL